jgi:hypothetical protein
MFGFRSFTAGVMMISAGLIVLTPGSAPANELIQSIRAWSGTANYTGPCPKEFKFSGNIQLNPQPSGGTLNYHWERSDGAKSAQKVVRIQPNQRMLRVNNNWTVGKSGQLSQALVVNSGNQHLRADTPVSNITCR